MTGYSAAPQVERIAEKLIAAHHQHLATVPIRYVWRDKAAQSKGNIVFGKARKVSGLAAHLVHLVRDDEPPDEVEFFVIEIAADMWPTLTDAQQTALIDHELCHLGVDIPEGGDKDRSLVVRGHDLEEFAAVVGRHGLWRPAVETFHAAVAMQLTLDDIAAPSHGKAKE